MAMISPRATRSTSTTTARFSSALPLASRAFFLVMWSLFSFSALGEPMDMFQEEELPFMHSTGLYAFMPPNGWSCRQLKDGSVECRTENGPAPGVCTFTHQTI